ncbi:MAG: protein kinase domain-containing protein [Acidimicrobiales bacterium]
MNGIADYRFLHQIGEGSHGTYWVADAPDRLGLDSDRVAVKVFRHLATVGDLDRMAEALERHRAVRSPHLVELYDCGQQGEQLYYSARYLPDGSLGRPTQPLSRAAVLRAVACAANAAHALHEAGLAHRSIKPSNILVDGRDARLGDVEVLALLQPGKTVTGLDQIRTIEYLAPELIRGEQASRATDIWALGATAHRVLTGRSTFPEALSGSLIQALRHVLDHVPQLDDSLLPYERRLIARALATDPIDRFATAADLARVLDELAGRELEAGPR